MEVADAYLALFRAGGVGDIGEIAMIGRYAPTHQLEERLAGSKFVAIKNSGFVGAGSVGPHDQRMLALAKRLPVGEWPKGLRRR